MLFQNRLQNYTIIAQYKHFCATIFYKYEIFNNFFASSEIFINFALWN